MMRFSATVILPAILVAQWTFLHASGAPPMAGAVLRERVTQSTAISTRIAMEARGQVTPGAGMPGADTPQPFPVDVQSRLEYVERIRVVDTQGSPLRSVRAVALAAVAINAPQRPTSSQLRPSVTTLLTSLHEGQVRCVSAGGPLTRPELDLVQSAGDPLLLPGLLPTRAVDVGDAWPVGVDQARSLTDYEALISNSLRAIVESMDDQTVRIRLAGEVRGAARGAEGKVTCNGFFTFDRRAGLIDHLELERSDQRQPGQVEAGIDFRGTLTIDRRVVAISADLTDAVLDALPAPDQPGLALLQFNAPSRLFELYHDRDWHLFWDDPRLVVLKRLDHGELVAQCNLTTGPKVAPGRHQDPTQFRQDIKTALGKRFRDVIGEGEIDGSQAGSFCYKVAVQGEEDGRDVLWYYYLLASPEGDQLLVTFTLNLADQERFASQDLQIIESLRWRTEAPPDDTARPAPPAP